MLPNEGVRQAFAGVKVPLIPVSGLLANNCGFEPGEVVWFDSSLTEDTRKDKLIQNLHHYNKLGRQRMVSRTKLRNTGPV